MIDSFERSLIRAGALLLSGCCRLLDLFLLVFRPRLIGPYLKLWFAQLKHSPYRWPSSFAATQARHLSGQEQKELVYGETPLVTALYLFWRAGLKKDGLLVDVCAGRGRALLAARWLGARAHGVELVEEHVEQTERILAAADVTLSTGDGATADLSSATHVYAAWSGFSEQTSTRFIETFASAPRGTKILVVGHSIEHESFESTYHGVLPYTWGPADVHIVVKTVA